MSHDEVAFAVSSSMVRRLENLREFERPSDVAQRNALLVVQTSTASTVHPTPPYTLEATTENIQNISGLPRAAPTVGTHIALGLIVEDPHDAAIVQIAEAPRLLIVRVTTHPIDLAWPETLPRYDHESLRNLAIKTIRAHDQQDSQNRWSRAIGDEISQLTRRAISEQRRLLYAELRRGSSNSGELVGLSASVQSTREYLSHIVVLAHSYELDADSESSMASALADIETVAQGIANDNVVRLQRQLANQGESLLALQRAIEAQNKQIASDASQEAKRDRRLARLVAALAFPALFVGFLGMNILPAWLNSYKLLGLHPAVAALVMLFVLAAAGYGLVALLDRPERSQ
ncbi:hypothetical protein [Cellulosimicrobium composti]|uniref:Magnesium transporter CorA family protein n=1 Tax=Cellulosimicrobium composti TaxID=2672572 RepID=A0ABX0B991_9MICO|nr:hypothetical protein [Cellulosimicrobium composti]NDO88205.1 hypothetical protein [Cellulosimicrobium composti]